ncbi:NAD-dependent succinate-semialdehyde dehydrogenase [Dasania marina]|uniref:NAD-dependent succinate-semialdehyde dehydrogenase n=1 Tax=Dasania marina TaxID=471499 RepID=UPI0030D8D8B7|tara:strand:- start:30975 stop:32465 length:1491 start_codon:yes stop_codon:yes gene_type:complete
MRNNNHADHFNNLFKLKDKSIYREQCYINGKWVGSENGEVIKVFNPADDSLLGYVASVGAVETRLAISAAEEALVTWRTSTAKSRCEIIRLWHDLIIENKDDLALLLTSEQGKPFSESLDEVNYAASFLSWFSEEGKRTYGDVIPSDKNDRKYIVVKEPVGVCAAITPWNFPLAMITRKAAPALAAGCTLILKPAEQTPYSALALAELADRAGVPAGVFNVLVGNAQEIGAELTKSKVVKKLTFTGSTDIGKLLMRQCADTVKKLSLELGGNAPFIVFDDADIDSAIQGVIDSKFRNSGQTCICTNRLLVHHDIYEIFIEKLVLGVSSLQLGNGLDSGVTIGPLIDRSAIAKITSHIEDALSLGARLCIGGIVDKKGGNFFEPTVICDVTNEMLVASEETFGPLLPIFKFHNDEEAIDMANSTDFGLAGYFFSRDIGRIWNVADRLEVGMVGVNTGLISTEAAPFGGFKQSGLGREGSKYGIEDYMQTKYICMAGL